MIQRSSVTWQDLSWQDQIKQLITDPEQLLTKLQLDKSLLPAAIKASRLFALRVTESYVSRIEPGNPNDPLLKQILPLGEECSPAIGFVADPLKEAEANPLKGVVHKYYGRVLIIGTTSCAINCRYCFRREFDYVSNRLSKADWQNIFEYLRGNNSISEVIFSGGDPLIQSDQHFQWLITELESIPTIKRLRVHSRLPIVLPARITQALLDAFSNSRFDNVWVIHCNHANEIDDEVADALRKIDKAKITLLNQAVLLKGINDDVSALSALSNKLFSNRTLPYYLHLLDKVAGAAHFDLPEVLAIALHRELAAQLPGYLVPKLVREEAGKDAKTPIF